MEKNITIEGDRRLVVQKALELTNKYQFCKNTYGSKSEGKFCTIGFLLEAHKALYGEVVSSQRDATENYYIEYIAPHVPRENLPKAKDNYQIVVGYNDLEATTMDDIQAVFEKSLEQQEVSSG